MKAPLVLVLFIAAIAGSAVFTAGYGSGSNGSFVNAQFIVEANEVCRPNRGLEYISPAPHKIDNKPFGTVHCINGAEFKVTSTPFHKG